MSIPKDIRKDYFRQVNGFMGARVMVDSSLSDDDWHIECSQTVYDEIMEAKKEFVHRERLD